MKNLINPVMYMLIAVLTTLLSCAGIAQDGKAPTRTKTFELNQPGTLDAKSSGGRVVVRAHNENKVIVEMYIRKNGMILPTDDPKVDEVLRNFDLDIEKNGSAITAIAKRRDNLSWKNEGIALTIFVPQEMSCNVSSSGGGVSISGVAGTHNFSSSGGSVRIDNTEGNTTGKSSGGKVSATNHKGEIHLRSSGGGVYLDEAYGNVDAHSSGGPVKLNNIHGDVDASSSGGGVHISGECEYVRATSSGGSVNVDISNLRKEMHLQSSGGGVHAIIQGGDELGLDLDLGSTRVKIDLHNFTGRSDKDRIKGAMNGGGIPVYMRASGGNVDVRFW